MDQELFTRVQAGLREGLDLEGLAELVRQQRDRGLGQDEALATLNALRAGLDEETEDRLLEVMDRVAGFCSSSQRIWGD